MLEIALFFIPLIQMIGSWCLCKLLFPAGEIFVHILSLLQELFKH